MTNKNSIMKWKNGDFGKRKLVGLEDMQYLMFYINYAYVLIYAITSKTYIKAGKWNSTVNTTENEAEHFC